eukprot:scaffold3180_cov399-Prasinococcus_capsulatus_cf.AAC.19
MLGAGAPRLLERLLGEACEGARRAASPWVGSRGRRPPRRLRPTLALSRPRRRGDADDHVSTPATDADCATSPPRRNHWCTCRSSARPRHEPTARC